MLHVTKKFAFLGKYLQLPGSLSPPHASTHETSAN